MKEYIENRVMASATYLIDNNSTIRGIAKHFKYSKSTAHLDLTKRLMDINPELGRKVKLIIAKNYIERSTRGGQATKRYWKEKERE